MFLHSSVGKRLGCFHFLSIMNNAKGEYSYTDFYMDMFSFVLSIYLRLEFLGHTVMCVSHFVDLPSYFPVSEPLYILPAIYEHTNFPTTSPTLVLFGNRYPIRYEMVFHCSFNLHFPNT